MADSITVQLNVQDRGTAAVKRFGQEIGRVFGRFSTQATQPTSRLRAALGNLTSGFRSSGSGAQSFGKSVSGSILPLKTLGAAIAAVGLARLVKSTTETAQRMHTLTLAMDAAAGGAKAGAAEFQFVRQQSERLGLELTGAASAYKGLLAATVAAGKSSEDARTVFTGVAEAARAMGMSNEETKGTMLALQQIMSKGKVQAEELRQQLGERFPVAIGVMAEALGVSTAELNKLMEQGKVTSDALIPFAQKLSEKYGKDLSGAMNSATAAQNRLTNTFTELKEAIGKGGLLDAVTLVANGLRDLFKELLATQAPQKLGQAFKELATQFAALVKDYGPGVVKTITTLTTLVAGNLRPAFDALGTTVKQVWAGINAGAEQLVAIVANVIGSIAQSLQWLMDKAAKAARFLGFDGIAESLQRTADGFSNLIREMGDVERQATQSRDAWLSSLADINRGTKAATSVTEDLASTVNQVAENTDLAKDAVVTYATELRQVDGVWTSVSVAAKKGGEAGAQAATVAKDAAAAYTTELRQVGGVWKSVSVAAKAGGAAGARAGSDTKTALDYATEATLRLKQKGEETAEALKTNFRDAGQVIGDSIAAGAKKGEEALKTWSERMREHTKKAKDAFDNFSITVEMPNTIQGLQKYIRETRNNMSRLQGNVNETGWVESQREIMSQRLEMADSKLKEMLIAQRELDQRYDQTFNSSSSSSAAGGSSGSREIGERAPAPPARIYGIGSSGDALPLGGSGGSGKTGSSLVLGNNDVGARLDEWQLGQLRDSGASGLRTDATTNRTVVIEGAQFNINQTGIDPQAIDARGLVRAMLPEMREAIRRGELNEVTTS